MQTSDHPRDEGASLVEVIVALGITATVLLALLSSTVFALSSSVEARQEQQAADYLNEVLEQARTAEYASLTMLASEVAAAPGVVVSGGVAHYDAGQGPEPVAASATGLITPQSETRTTSNGVYTVRRYVTIPATATFDANGQPSLRRVTVEVAWSAKDKPRLRRSSTLVTLTRRGLPLPAFTWAYNGPASVPDGTPTWTKNPGNEVDYGFVLQNQGARETWTLSAPGAWSWYRDTDRDGLWSGDATEPALTGASTGPVEPGTAPVHVVAHRVIGSTESGTSTTAFTATPASDPSKARSVTTRLTVQTGAVTPPQPTASPTSGASTPVVCQAGSSKGTSDGGSLATASAPTAYTLQRLTLAKTAPGSALGDTTATAVAPMTRETTVLEPELCNWSTDLQTSQAGRWISSSGSSVAVQAEWHFQPAHRKQDEYAGTPVVTMWVQCPSGTPDVTLTLLSRSDGVYTTRATTTVPTTGCDGSAFYRGSVALPAVSAFGIPLTGDLVLRVTSSGPVRFGYGAQSVPASLTIGMR